MSAMLAFLSILISTQISDAAETNPRNDAVCENRDLQTCFEHGFSLFAANDQQMDRRASEIFEYTCELGLTAGCAELGLSLVTGRGVPANFERGQMLIDASCNAADGLACTYMALTITDMPEQDPASIDWPRAISYYERACALGEDNACFNLSGIYAGWFESPIDADMEASIILLEESCARQFEPSCEQLANQLLEEPGAENIDRALQLRSNLCDRGLASACHALGYTFLHGDGVAADAPRAVSLFSRACELGSAIGCTNLGWMHAESLLEGASDIEAARLYRLGCNGGYQEGCEMLSELTHSPHDPGASPR